MSTGPVELQGITINAGILETLQGFSTQRNVLKGITIAVGTGASIMQLKVLDRNHEPIEGATCRVLNGIVANNVLSFDGVDDWINTSASSWPASGQFCVEALVFVENITAQFQGIVGHWQSGVATRTFIGLNNGRFGLSMGNTTYQGAIITNNSWYRVSAVRNSNNTIQFYVNGELYFSATNSANVHQMNTTIGSLFGGVYPFKGKISDVRIWNTSKTQSQVQNLMYERLAGNESGLVEYWEIGEGAGTLVNGITNNGTIYGATWAEVEDLPILNFKGQFDTTTPYDSQTTNANGLTTLNYQINTIHGLEVTLPGKRRFIMPFKRTARGLLDWQVMLSDYLATFATDKGNILINSEPENNDANFLIE